jgi:hypothetical protein
VVELAAVEEDLEAAVVLVAAEEGAAALAAGARDAKSNKQVPIRTGCHNWFQKR